MFPRSPAPRPARTSRPRAAFLFLVVALFTWSCTGPGADRGAEGQQGRFDLLLEGGRVVDGTGSPWFEADVGVADGRIAAVGDLGDRGAERVIDAEGMVVSPGFVDMHTHSEYSLLDDGRALSKIRQGVTTEVVGESSSPAPRRSGMELGRGAGDIEADWTTLAGYFDRLESEGVSVNVVSYVGAGQLRRHVVGEEHREPTDEEMEEMKALLAEAMEDGAVGLTTALETPGQSKPSPAVPDTDQLVELASVVGRYGGIYGTHLRDQGPRLEEAIEEAAEIGERAGVPVEIYHLKAAGYPNRGKMEDALDAIAAARERGVDVAADQYPYIAAAHGLAIEVPRWVHEGGRERFLERIQDPELRPRIERQVREYMTTKYYNEREGTRGFDAVRVSSVRTNPDEYVGKTIGQIAREAGKDPATMVLDLLVEQQGDVGVVMFYMSEEDVRRGMQSRLVSVCSDGRAVSPDFGGKPHPRYYGSFPRVLARYVREEGVLSLEEAVRKMTAMPAQRMGLLDRGLVREGMWADLVVFDPERIDDRATFDEPHRFPDGIPYVVVNGEVVIDEGEHTGAAPGRALRGPGHTETEGDQ